MLAGQITEIITSRTFVSFEGYMAFRKDDTEYRILEKVFTYLSNEHRFYCNHVVLKIQFFNDVYYIGYNDNEIHIGNTYHRVEKEDSREIIPVDYKLSNLYRKVSAVKTVN